MEELRDLQQIYNAAANRFNDYAGKDFILPKAFKEQVKDIYSSKITFNDYSAIIVTSTGQNIFLPNQWFYIASYFTDLYNELLKYKEYALKIISRDRLKELKGGQLTNGEESLLRNLPLNMESKSYLSKFITDYDWWYGAKTIDRGDFYVSPILSSANLVNVTQSYVADLCAFLADKQDLVNLIINDVDNNNVVYSSQSLHNTPQKEYLQSYLTALRTKPFMLLAGISGTGKSRIVRKLAQATTTQAYENDEDRWKDNRPENFELIQVKPNWHNSMDVVGFYSNISKKYEFTPFVEFIVKAWQHTDTPYFLCLDEMNLAPVEEYFAEFLSAIESRSTDKDGNYVTDPIIKPFKEFGKEACEEMLKHLLGEALYTESNPLAKQFAEKGLTLPPNLMVMGTVNMDETTFSFSRKVLDRAMSIEMNEVDYDSFLSGDSDQFPLLTDWNEWLVNRPQQASEVKDQIDSEKVITYLKAVNGLMEGSPFKLGYRAANEALLYVAASQTLGGESFSLEKAMDEFTLMKILSRIEGDDNRLALDENDPRIAAIGVDTITDTGEDSINLLNNLRAIVRKYIGTETVTEKKINSMYRTLEREHFVSYWA